MLRAQHVLVGLGDEPGVLVSPHGVAAVPVDGRAANGEVDRRHHAPPLHEPREVRKTVRILHGDQIPLPGLSLERATPAYDAAAQ